MRPSAFRWLAFPVTGWALLFLIGGGLAAADDAGGPPAVPLERYEALIQHSPFALATAAAATPAPVKEETASFANNYYVVGMAQMGEKPFVTISSRDRQQRFSLFVGETSADGITLSSVEWLPEVGKSRVTLKQGVEFGVVSFDEAAMKPAPPPAVPSPTPAVASFPQRGNWQAGAAAQGGGNQNGRRRWRERGEGNDAARMERIRQWRERQRSIGAGR